MSFIALIPARLASTRLPNKPLADIGGLPMVVRVAQQAARSGAGRVVVAADSERILDACAAHGVEALLTRADHVCGSDRLAEACDLLGLSDEAIVVNVQGDEPLIAPDLVAAVADLLAKNPQASMSTAAHAINNPTDFLNPNVVKVVLDAQQMAMYFSRAPIAYARDGQQGWDDAATANRPLRHYGVYGYRAGFLRLFPRLQMAPMEGTEALEQLRALWHGYRIAVHLSASAPAPGVDTPEDLARVRAMLG